MHVHTIAEFSIPTKVGDIDYYYFFHFNEKFIVSLQ